MGQIKFITSMVLIGLFAIAIVTYAINFAVDNDSNVSLGDDSDFTGMQSEMQENFTVFYGDIDVVYNSTQASTISSQTEATEGGTPFKVGPTTALRIATSTIALSFSKVFGAGSSFAIFLTSLIAVLGFIAAMYIYKTWAGRNPD